MGWYWNWSSNTLATWCEEPTHWKIPRCWERLRAGGEGGDRGWDGWMVPLTQWIWVWANSRRQWRTGKPGVLQLMGLQRVGQNFAMEQQQQQGTWPDWHLQGRECHGRAREETGRPGRGKQSQPRSQEKAVGAEETLGVIWGRWRKQKLDIGQELVKICDSPCAQQHHSFQILLVFFTSQHLLLGQHQSHCSSMARLYGALHRGTGPYPSFQFS